MRRRTTALSLAAAGLIASGCAVNPVSGWPEFVLVSKASEQKLGDEEAVKVEQEMGLVEGTPLAAYVADVGARVAEHSPRTDVEYHFRLVDSVILNAFALPGGHVYVTRGLLVMLNSEDELANVLGHEVGHVAARHAVQRVTRAAPLAVATGIPAAAVGLVLPRLGRTIGTVGQFANSLALAPYSRGQEMEADRVGQAMAAEAGWDPTALASFMATLQAEERMRGEQAPSSFLRTHPLTEERVEQGTEYAETLEAAAPNRIAEDRAAFLARLEGMLVGPNPAEGLFEENVFLQPDLDLWLRFPMEWQTDNGREFVAARSPDGTAGIVLQIAAPEGDPLDVGRAFAQGEGAPFGLLPKAMKLGHLDAARAYGHSRGATIDVTWIAYGGYVYQLTGICSSRDYQAYQTPFIDVGLSLRPLTPAERDGIQEQRLRVVAARAGESLAALVERSAGDWTVEETAVANALAADAVLEAGQLVKVPVSERYRKR